MKEGKIYPPSIIQAINSVIKECAASSGLFPTQANPSLYLSYLFNWGEDYYIPENAFQCIWYNLIQFQRLRKEDWIKSYWEQAVCHANLHLDGFPYVYYSNPDINKKQNLLFKFQEFHQMYCAYLLSQYEFHLIKHLREYSNSSPYTNSLVQCDFADICRHLINMSQPLYMDGHYPFYSINGVKEGTVAESWYKKYVLLGCLVFPKTSIELEMYGMSLSEIVSYLTLIKELIPLLNEDRGFIEIIHNKAFKDGYNVTEEDINDLKSQLETLANKIEIEIQQQKENEIIPEDNIDEFIKSVNSLVRDSLIKYNIPVKFSNTIELVNKVALPENLIPKNFFSEDKLISYINFPETFASFITHSIFRSYVRRFKLNSPRYSIKIDFSEIEQAFSILSLNNSYSVLSLGVSLPETLNIPQESIHYIDVQYSEIIIIRRSEVPLMIVKENPIDINIIEDKQNKEMMKIESSISFNYEQVKFIHYLRLRIVFQNYQGIPSELSKLESIDHYV